MSHSFANTGKIFQKYKIEYFIYKHISVLGLVPSNELGVTFTDEHLSINGPFFFNPPPVTDLLKSQCEWKIENLGWINQWP